MVFVDLISDRRTSLLNTFRQLGILQASDPFIWRAHEWYWFAAQVFQRKVYGNFWIMKSCNTQKQRQRSTAPCRTIHRGFLRSETCFPLGKQQKVLNATTLQDTRAVRTSAKQSVLLWNCRKSTPTRYILQATRLQYLHSSKRLTNTHTLIHTVMCTHFRCM